MELHDNGRNMKRVRLKCAGPETENIVWPCAVAHINWSDRQKRMKEAKRTE